MTNFIKKLIPTYIKDYIKKQILNTQQNGNLLNVTEKNFYCPVCNENITHFERLQDFYFEKLDKVQNVHSFFHSETFHYLKYYCSNCYSSDRNRLYALYLKAVFEKQTKEVTFLDIAPDQNLSNWIKSFPKVNYRSTDLKMENADDKVDITCMPMYKDGSYDIVLCSHVLEHVVEDRKAISEIYRILKPDGFAIIMVPLALLLEEDLECDDYNTDDLRWKYYGQNDHVRMYSKPGFKNKLNNAGFKISEFDINYFGEETFNKCGIHHRSVLYIVNK